MKALFIIFGLFFCACTDMLDERHFEICSEVKTYVDQFYNEARIRGIILQKNDLIVHMENINKGSHPVVGQTDVSGKPIDVKLDIVFVDTFLQKRTKQDSLWVQLLIFHELGHGILYKEHVKTNSIMNKDIGVCSIDYVFNANKRKLLIDELFDH